MLHANSAWSVKPDRYAPGIVGSTVYSLRQVYGRSTVLRLRPWMTQVQHPPPPFPTLVLQFPHRHCSSLPSLSHDITHHRIPKQELLKLTASAIENPAPPRKKNIARDSIKHNNFFRLRRNMLSAQNRSATSLAATVAQNVHVDPNVAPAQQRKS